ncbi:L-lysine 6-monooxygenase (NADPH-requiring)-domain-containing protein [Geopyxis carbonaria]|nr:L-lysine 6-monooxygenase (NADPH-requiring)-domain-containing protein [Geopyxis carbonaria]
MTNNINTNGNGAAEVAKPNGTNGYLRNGAAPVTNEVNGVHNDLQRIKNGFPDGQTNGNVATNGYGNGHLNGESNHYEDEEPYDIICVGFGPASLAIATALHDRELPSRALFLERQPKFAWHSGMLLPGSRMQISFMKDLATFRNPRSEFTFLNYLHQNNRLSAFTNLGTFLPLREEFNDYLSWCAGHFDDQVRYSEEVIAVSPVRAEAGGKVTSWEVLSKSSAGKVSTLKAKNVVIAVGGRPNFPTGVTQSYANPGIIHSSQYSDAVPRHLTDKNREYNIAVVGAGQSSAEIFNDLHTKYPNAKTSLFIRQHALKPSDDSPFVNEIFDPERVDALYQLPASVRASSIAEDRATNYSVVRLNLLENLYDMLYHQRLRNPDQEAWQHRIHPHREIVGSSTGPDGKIDLVLRDTRTGDEVVPPARFDAVIFGTGYKRDVHETILKPTKSLMKNSACSVGRDYKVIFDQGAVAEDAGIYLQGCCEKTHGLSDSLLSILAVRGGELVDTIYGTPDKEEVHMQQTVKRYAQLMVRDIVSGMKTTASSA